MQHPTQDGHAFMLLGPTGTVLWHKAYADMYVKPQQLISNMNTRAKDTPGMGDGLMTLLTLLTAADCREWAAALTRARAALPTPVPPAARTAARRRKP